MSYRMCNGLRGSDNLQHLRVCQNSRGRQTVERYDASSEHWNVEMTAHTTWADYDNTSEIKCGCAEAWAAGRALATDCGVHRQRTDDPRCAGREASEQSSVLRGVMAGPRSSQASGGKLGGRTMISVWTTLVAAISDIPRPCRDTGPPHKAGFVFLGFVLRIGAIRPT